MTSAQIRRSAPGKVILLGEHAVVHGRPAIAVPVTQVRATAALETAPPGSGLSIVASDLNRSFSLSTASRDEPLAAAARLALAHLASPEPDATATVRSTLPIASGLGSGAAVSTALIRALAAFLGHAPEPATINVLVFEVEKIHHGTPSGIDNTVIVYEQAVYFMRGRPIERLTVSTPFTLLVGDTGVPSPTKRAVTDVRWAWERDPAHYDALFDQIGDVTDEARRAIEIGDIEELGMLMTENHALLMEMGVSSPQLDDLVDAAQFAGALGAKLSGAGRGGNMIALAEDDLAEEIAQALREAGAQGVIRTRVASTG